MYEYFCDRCGQLVHGREDRYTMKIELFASKGTLEITEEDLQKDHRAEIERLTEEMAKQDPRKLMAEVYCSYTLDLCPACRKAVYRRLEQGELLKHI
jgi:hypothetical protein